MPLGGEKKKVRAAAAPAKQGVNQSVRAGHQSRGDTGAIIPILKDGFEEEGGGPPVNQRRRRLRE